MVGPIPKLRRRFRIHAFTPTWDAKKGYPTDLNTPQEVCALLKKWADVRERELVDGMEELVKEELSNVSCMEVEVFYE